MQSNIKREGVIKLLYNDDIINTDDNFDKIAKAFRDKLQGNQQNQNNNETSQQPNNRNRFNFSDPNLKNQSGFNFAPHNSRKPLNEQFQQQTENDVVKFKPPIQKRKPLMNDMLDETQQNIGKIFPPPFNTRKPISEQVSAKPESSLLQPNPHYNFSDMIKIIENSNHLYNMLLFSEANLIELTQYLQKSRYRVQTAISSANSFLQKLRNQKLQFKSVILQNKPSKSAQNVSAQRYTKQNSRSQILHFLHCQNEILRLIFWMLIFTNVSNNKHQLSLLNELSATHLSILTYLHSIL